MIRRGIVALTKMTKLKKSFNLGSIRYFATSAQKDKSSNSLKGIENLKKCLDKEITYEETNYQPVSNEDMEKFLKENGFEFKESEHSTEMELKKSVDNLDVKVIFHAR